ncbi:hypothetical protein A2159_00970 [Candidatus Woesebacteria bacterium RBG_13_34_9]|uniref:Type IV pilus assembly protein PilM n=1 Tax=Candidatus Woesebacteria bacterium RBG_13_34_9 TaxID=1802477 RepID=A0A1F7X5B5_9BACT|nr:MAG: hypothetical protein A2159_00970 [Candidatus Woesebacteria bacterium RBG_13_34_9]
MFKKSFISLYILPGKLVLLQLSSDKKKVIRHILLDIPEGIIENYKIIDINSLSQILAGIWRKYHIDEKTVGIILPEFSTYTKFFKIPKVDFSELNEAVNWQAQEYLPAQLTELIMDWKIVEKTDSGYEILIVATRKDILLGYVESVVKAGLFPLAVEIPSICLVRLLGLIGGGKLIIFRDFGDTILVLTFNNKIIGTSVLHTRSNDEIIKTSSRMVSHYKETSVEEILVAGSEISEDLIKKFSSEFKYSVKKIEPQAKGFDDDNSSQYIIPYSMQLVEPEEPADPMSLNLLPANLVAKYKFERMKLQVWSLTLTITLFVWIAFFVSLSAYLLFSDQTKTIKEKNSSQVKISQQREAYQKDVTRINSISEQIMRVKAVSVFPQTVLNEIGNSKPAGIEIKTYEIDLDSGDIVLTGISANRTSLLEFRKNIENSNLFSEVSIPVSSYEKEQDLEFQITFSYKFNLNVNK